MLTNSLADLYFSASALKCYDTCKLKFRRRYIDGLFWPSDWVTDEQEQKIYETGQLFHTLAERYYVRGEMEAPKQLMSEQITKWLENLISYCPYQETGEFYPEQSLRLNKEVQLVAKFDLLYISPNGQAVIYDWKTNNHQLKREYWEHSYQTLVYRSVLQQAGGSFAPKGRWQPEQVSLIYWNPRYPEQELEFYYSREQFNRDQQRLEKLIMEIKDRDYDEFYGVDNDSCLYCEYRPLCHGQDPLEIEREEEDIDLDLEWEDVEAIEF